jgi:hypothetical protein
MLNFKETAGWFKEEGRLFRKVYFYDPSSFITN